MDEAAQRRSAAIWAVPGRPVRAVIDLDAIRGNLAIFRQMVTPGTRIMAVVKADGYGHGAEMIALVALAAGASELGVATVSEGRTLRQAGVGAPILVLGPIDPSEIGPALSAGLSLALGDVAFAERVFAEVHAAHLSAPASLQIKVDTGMRRFGVDPAGAVALARRVTETPSVRLSGIFTHFADADGADTRFTHEQAGAFDACVAMLTTAGLRPECVHAANSAAMLRWRRFDYDLVRVGIALYGLPPGGAARLPPGVRPALSLHGRLARVVTLQPGETVSYSRTYRAERPERIGLVPIGYADGYWRALSNRGWMGIGGRAAPVRGRVCMDQAMVGLPDSLNIPPGEEVVIYGPAESGAPDVPRVAAQLGTIPYEVVTSLARRIPRVYVAGERVVAVRDSDGLQGEAGIGTDGHQVA